ncbi:hypothetical protein H6F51_10180 [Cyanobacteria bacterium FACHB-DQ100]|nr:hypothetical protein [Cyanobacteria bacterium FACHB-DQ100]
MDTALVLEKSSEQSLEQAAPQLTSENSIDIQELSIVIVANELSAALLNPEFFVFSGIVPREWQLARNSVTSQQVTQLVFQNGISLLVEPGKISFSESINGKAQEDIAIARMAAKFVETMPKVDYQAIGINPKRIVTFQDQADGARKYLLETLLSPGEWQQFGREPMQASLNLSYLLDDCRFQLSIHPTQLRLSDDSQISGLLFSGNFHYELSVVEIDDRSKLIAQALSNWYGLLEAYRSLLKTKFQIIV